MPWHSSRRSDPGRVRAETYDFAVDHLLAEPAAAPISTRRADCCVGAAAYRAMLPVTESRHQVAELLLCPHHFRRSQIGLARAGAAVFDTRNRLVDSAGHWAVPRDRGR